MQRADIELAFMLQYENIAWYENGKVSILDRRIYPTKIEFVLCTTYQQVAEAISDMVTQSAGPYTAAAMGMALAAYECKHLNKLQQIEFLELASYTLSHARPTTVDRMQYITKGCLSNAINALDKGENTAESIVRYTIEINNNRYNKIAKMAEYLVETFPNNAKILTQCFGETIVGMMLKEAKKRNNDIKIYCAETRPYFQGARLTASVACDMGFDVTVITDNMPAYVIQKEKIDIFTSAADVICGDGHVVNKIGTFQIAIACDYLGIPYYVTGAPDKGHPSVENVIIENRNPDFVLQAMGIRTAMQGVKGYYPAFDITPPSLVKGVVTDCGIYLPQDLANYYHNGNNGEYDIVI